MFKLILFSTFVLIATNCSTISLKEYPEHWPLFKNNPNISGNYENNLVDSTQSGDKPTLFNFFLSIYQWGSYKYFDENYKQDLLTQSLDIEYARNGNHVELIHEEKKITASLYHEKKLIKKIIFYLQGQDNKKVILKSQFIMHGEVVLHNFIEFLKVEDGSLVANIKTERLSGWFIENKHTYNDWFLWKQE